jgi:small subunit ribosomal protein S16
LSVKIRLARHGAKKAPYYRVVVADSRSPRNGRFIEVVGRYNPRQYPLSIEMNLESVDAWIIKGAQPTEAAAKIIAIAKGEKELIPEKESVSKRAQAKAEAEKKAAAEAKEKAAAEKKAVKEAAKEEAAKKEAAKEAPAEEPAEEAAPATETPEKAEETSADALDAPAEAESTEDKS